MHVNIKEARQRFSELVNTVALSKERVVITSRNKPKAVLISLHEAESLGADSVRKACRQMQLESIKKLRLRLTQKGVTVDTRDTLDEIRRVRVENLSNDR